MSGHLPECFDQDPSIHGTYRCICPPLRACENRTLHAAKAVLWTVLTEWQVFPATIGEIEAAIDSARFES